MQPGWKPEPSSFPRTRYTRRNTVTLWLRRLRRSSAPMRGEESEEVSKMSVGWGVIGAGGIADRRTIPEGILPARNAHLVAVMGRNEPRVREVAEKYGGVAWYTKEEDLLANGEVQAVYVATPNHLHCEQTVRALRAGKHVLCEKPMAMNLAEGEKMIEVAQEHNLKLAIGYMMRFHAWHQELKRLV
ncbi:MAG TPA: Gfo/Idh/MocA family oxidoreductase, partial [Armatimonadetes bacterium]|nr:Gfo/Idh/MocA family oxidoreductase [Armatimonadota bacterium]